MLIRLFDGHGGEASTLARWVFTDQLNLLLLLWLHFDLIYVDYMGLRSFNKPIDRGLIIISCFLALITQLDCNMLCSLTVTFIVSCSPRDMATSALG